MTRVLLLALHIFKDLRLHSQYTPCSFTSINYKRHMLFLGNVMLFSIFYVFFSFITKACYTMCLTGVCLCFMCTCAGKTLTLLFYFTGVLQM